jgi:aminoglycoside phosphotransferase (APT) family kinase protein
MEKDTLIGSGRTADIYAWGEGRILKLYQDRVPSFLAEQEYTVTRAVQAAGIPVPTAYDLIEINGRLGIVFERIEGISLLAEFQAKPWILFAGARSLGELHAQIHNTRAPVELPPQRERIENAIETAQDLAEPEKQAARDCLAQLPEGESLCHGDFHPDNILLAARGPVIIDWMTATRGHPPADVARTSLLFQTGGLPPSTPTHVRLMTNASRVLLHSLYLNRYLQLRPTNRREIDRWQLPLLAARLREVEAYPQEKRMLLKRLKALLKEQPQ